MKTVKLSICFSTFLLLVLVVFPEDGYVCGQDIHWINTTGGDNQFDESSNWLENVSPEFKTCIFDQVAQYDVAFPVGTGSTRFRVIAGDVSFVGNSTTYSISSSSRSQVDLGGSLTLDRITLNCTNSLDGIEVGCSDTGTLKIQNGSSIINGYFATVGREVGSNGNVELASGSTWPTQTLIVGWEGAGTMSITGGSSVWTIEASIGHSATGIGELIIGGVDSSLQVVGGGGMIVGKSGTGLLRIIDNADIAVTNRIGSERDSSGTVIISGARSVLTGRQLVGGRGTGELIVENGGTGLGSLTMAESVDTAGTIRIRGANSSWTTPNFASPACLGGQGDAVVEVTDGGYFETHRATLGDVNVSTTVITIRDQDSKWTNLDNLIVGIRGDDCLFVENGGAFETLGLDLRSDGMIEVTDGIVTVIDEFKNTGGRLIIDTAGSVHVLGDYVDESSGFTSP